MIKLAGLGLVVLCSSMTGIFVASGLSKKVEWMETNIQLVNYLADRLKYLQSSVYSLLADAAAQPQFARLGYLEECRKNLEAGNPFPQSWRWAVDGVEMDREVAGILGGLDHVLGGLDLETQLTSLAYTRELLEKRLETARTYRDQHSRLYRTLGLLGGLTVAILLA